MEKEFVPYETALQLKELGFDEPCLKVGNPNGHIMWKWIEVDGYPPTVSINDIIQVHYSKVWIQIPTFSQAFRWFREKYELTKSITDFIDDKTGIEWDYAISIIGTDLDEKGNYTPLVDYSIDDETRKFKTYEDAELACLDKLIELTKNK